MTKENESTFDTIFPLIQDAINKITLTKEWIEHDSIVIEIKENQLVKDYYSEYSKKNYPPKKSYEKWVGDQVAWFGAWYTDGRRTEIMQKYISKFERGVKIKGTNEFERRDKGKKKDTETWAYKVKKAFIAQGIELPKVAKIQEESQLTEKIYLSNPQEIDVSEIKRYIEGDVTQILVNKYGRSKAAWEKCVEYHKYTCKVCDFNFKETYGEIGKDFIHVHHLKEIHTNRKKYGINPITDLIPVCPNCHAMLHKRKPPYTPKELREIIDKQKANNSGI